VVNFTKLEDEVILGCAQNILDVVRGAKYAALHRRYVDHEEETL